MLAVRFNAGGRWQNNAAKLLELYPFSLPTLYSIPPPVLDRGLRTGAATTILRPSITTGLLTAIIAHPTCRTRHGGPPRGIRFIHSFTPRTCCLRRGGPFLVNIPPLPAAATSGLLLPRGACGFDGVPQHTTTLH